MKTEIEIKEAFDILRLRIRGHPERVDDMVCGIMETLDWVLDGEPDILTEVFRKTKEANEKEETA